MSNFGTGFANGLVNGMAFGTMTMAARSGFYGMGMYNAGGLDYFDTVYCDLDSPMGLSSWADNGYMLNNYGYIGNGQFVGGYSGGYTGYSPFGIFGGFGGFGNYGYCFC